MTCCTLSLGDANLSDATESQLYESWQKVKAGDAHLTYFLSTGFVAFCGALKTWKILRWICKRKENEHHEFMCRTSTVPCLVLLETIVYLQLQ